MLHSVRMLRAALISLGLISTGVVVGEAQEASPEAGPPEGCTVVAEGLINPRYVALGDDGTLYITEAGNGGDEDLTPPGEEATPEDAPQLEATPAEADAGGTPEGPQVGTRGDTGQITAVSPDGEQSVVADGLPSYSEGVGPAGIVVGDGELLVATGGSAVVTGIDPLENENSILRIDIETGEVTQVAELGSYEVENNPDGDEVHPNLYGMDIGADGLLYVADAGGNTVYSVDPATGEFDLVGVVPGPALPEAEEAAADATPIADEELGGPPESVPTGLHVGEDGNVYVITLGAFVPGAAEVLIVQADGTFVNAATGLSVGVGVALGPDGALYASQLASFTSETEPPGPGNVVRIGEDGSIEPVVEGVPFPHGITFDEEGNLYVVANSTVFGPPPSEPNGEVWRCDGVASGEAASATVADHREAA
ncbi:MAG: ScyD/ScyE family protein [Chloroflexota bacterium]|nr:ScyD/ScyE family protein [Chloroflexota bacterium]